MWRGRSCSTLQTVVIDFDKDYEVFRETSGTSMILDMLEERSDLVVAEEAYHRLAYHDRPACQEEGPGDLRSRVSPV